MRNPIYGPVRCCRGSFQKSRRPPAGTQSPTAATDVSFSKSGSPRAGSSPHQGFRRQTPRDVGKEELRKGGGGEREERSRRSRGQNTTVPLAALPATTVAAGGETRERERGYNRRRLLTKQIWVRASWRW